jgi:small subunit ribosomal protein S20
MAITKSAKKAHRRSLRQRARNLVYLDKMKSLLKEVRNLVSQKKIKEANALLNNIYKALDKAAKKGVIKKNTASRKKSRIARAINRH